MPLLSPGDPFPDLTLITPGGQTATVPERFAGQFGVQVVALSVDDEPTTTAALIAKHGLTSWSASAPTPA